MRDKGLIRDVALSRFQGADGLMQLLALAAEERLPLESVIEMIKRIHIPGYERARSYLGAAAAHGVFEPNTRPGFPWQSQLDLVLRWLDEDEDNGF